VLRIGRESVRGRDLPGKTAVAHSFGRLELTPIDDTTPRFALTEAESVLHLRFGLTGVLAPLPSERDQNFSIETSSGERFVLKIAKSDERREVLDLQNSVLAYLGEEVDDLVLPRLKKSSDGAQILEVPDHQGRTYFVRLLSWVDGVPLVQATPHDERVLKSLGCALAKIDKTLQAFAHPAMRRDLHWDLRHADRAFRHSALLSTEQETLVYEFSRGWYDVRWQELRHGVIHGDANDYNVLVRAGQVVSLLDFGDMVHSAVVCDLAIAIAYVMLDKPDPLSAAGSVVAAYHRVFPLTAAEADALFTLAASRLCMSVCYAALNARQKGSDDYQQVTAAPAWKLIAYLASLPAGFARAALSNACETL
jgi:Ser/Thr protein kinase RdoA (MazF antagonist)